MADLKKYKEVATLTGEFVKIFQNENLGATPKFPNYRTEIAGNGSATYKFEVPYNKIYKLKKIKISCEPDVFYVTMWIDGLGDVLPRQMIRADNSVIDLPTEIFVREEIRIYIENTTSSSQTISITLFVTQYEKKLIDDIQRELFG